MSSLLTQVVRRQTLIMMPRRRESGLYINGPSVNKITKAMLAGLHAVTQINFLWGFIEKGSLWVAQTSDRLHTLKRQYSTTKALGIDREILTHEQLREKVPIIDPHEIWGDLWLPNDFMGDPVPLALTFAQLAIANGVKIIEDCYVEEILTEKQRTGQSDRVTGAVTSKWARELEFQTSPSVRFSTQVCVRFYIQPLADHSILIDDFLRQSKPIFSNGVPNTFHFSLLPDNWDDFHWILSNTIKRFPILAESECETLITGADSFTPDGRLIINESAEATLAGDVGKYIAELIYNANTNLSTWPADIRRFMRLHTNKRFLQDRLREIPGKQYSLKYPTYANQSVVDFLQMLCALNIDKPIVTVVHTGMLNEQGVYENDCFAIRLGEYHFLLVSPTSQSTRNMIWLKTHVPEDNSIFLSDVTSLYTALNVIEPKVKYLLSELSDENFNDFARMTCQVSQIRWSGAPIYRNGEFCGFITSAAYGFTLGKQ
ncbi:unnamed protein product, partial [Adineta steineri]